MNKILPRKPRSHINTFPEFQFTWIIPSAIDLPKILAKNKPSFTFRIDFFYHLIDLICRQTEYLDLDKENQWVFLNAQRLQKFNQNYQKYLDHLEKVGIIKVDNQYKVGKKSRGYRISPRYYAGEPVDIPVNKLDLRIREKLRSNGYLEKRQPELAGYDHLTKWFNPKLRIDVEKARENIDQLYPTVNGNIIRKDEPSKDGKVGKYKALRTIKLLQRQEYYYHVDDNIGRFHTNLTTGKKEIRNHLTYDGKSLVNLDIKNCQPLLSGILLKGEFYREGENFNINSIQSLIPLIPNPNIFTKYLLNIYYSIMLAVSSETQYKREFEKYLALIQAGTFYEKMSELMHPGLPINRAKIKELTFIIFFCDNRHGVDLRKKEEPFKKEFPLIYSIFATLKRSNSTILSHILQRMETEIVIERASRRIALDRPDLPIFTIHDSIATTVGDEDYVEEILKEEILKMTGLIATIGKEYWSPETPDETLQQRAA